MTSSWTYVYEVTVLPTVWTASLYVLSEPCLLMNYPTVETSSLYMGTVFAWIGAALSGNAMFAI